MEVYEKIVPYSPRTTYGTIKIFFSRRDKNLYWNLSDKMDDLGDPPRKAKRITESQNTNCIKASEK